MPLRLLLIRRIDEFEGRLKMYESPWAQNAPEMTYMNQEPEILEGPIDYNADNLYPQPNPKWYSLDISYTHMNGYWG